MHDIFISYSRKDRDAAKEIEAKIKKQNPRLQCWIDTSNIETGTGYWDNIVNAIDGANIVVCLLSKNSMESDWVKKELGYAIEKKKRIIPINIDDCKLQNVFSFLLAGIEIGRYDTEENKARIIADITGTTVKISNKYNLWIVIQTIILSILTLLDIWMLLSKPCFGVSVPLVPLLLVSLLIILFMMIIFTIKLKHNNKFKWSFIFLDIIALGLIFFLCIISHEYAINYKLHYTSLPYKALKYLGSNDILTGTCFCIIWILHSINIIKTFKE